MFHVAETPRVCLTLHRVHVEGFKSLRDVALDLKGRNPVVLVGANGAGKTNIIELFLFLRRALHDELSRRPYAPHAEWGNPRNLTWEATGTPIRVELDYMLTVKNNNKYLQEMLTYTVLFAPDPAFTTIRPVFEKIELPGLGFVLERVQNRLVTRLKAVGDMRELLHEIHKCCNDASMKCSEGWCWIEQSLKESKEDVPPVLVASAPLHVGRIAKGFTADIVLFTNCCVALIPFPENQLELSAGKLLGILHKWFRNIVVLRQVDYSIVKWPHNRYNDNMLQPRAENLAEVLYRVMGNPKGRERVEAAIATLFPWLEISVEFNEYGQIGLVFYEKRGERKIQLYPSMVPDGVVKLLSIIVAIALKPSLLAVDEIENSLHASLIDYLMRELEDMEDPVIIATHSPVVVDLAGPERTLLVSRSTDGSTLIEKLAPPQLWEKMKEEGLMLSDYYLYTTP